MQTRSGPGRVPNGALFNIVNGSTGAANPPNYPNAWLRIKREGQKLTAFRSSDGTTWSAAGEVTYKDDPASAENELLADKVFVGMFYAPEFLNISDEALRVARSASIGKFRDYGDFSTGGVKPTITRVGNTIRIAWTGAGVLESADTLTGTWTAVAGAANPATITPSGTVKFYRVR